ncbi:MAG TPA: MerR family transcriptional regulator [Acidimicrobiales bacterium]|nr:MerR family transcriptional regulator [Acidimicrobiales bacterium]
MDELEYRIDGLAREAGTTVRNVRAYQDRGLLPPPRRDGRLGIYSPAHLARLRMIGSLLERGYTLANIAELLAAWERGQDVGALLGFEAAIGATWSDEPAVTVSRQELADLFGDIDEGRELVQWAVTIGFLVVDDDGFRIDNPMALDLGVLLLRHGVPPRQVMRTGRNVRDRVEAIAGDFVDLVDTHVFGPFGDILPADDLPRLAELVGQLRPLAKRYVDAELSRAIERMIRERFGEHLRRVAGGGDRTGDQPVDLPARPVQPAGPPTS